MGGTWVHWHMPHIYREISYYGLHNDWIVTQNPGSKEDYFTVTTGDEKRNCSHDEEVGPQELQTNKQTHASQESANAWFPWGVGRPGRASLPPILQHGR